MNNTEKLVPLGRMARRLGLRPEWLRAATDAGDIPAVKVGDGWLFDAAAVQSVLIERASKAGEGVRDAK